MTSNIKGRFISFKRFEIHDGDGIRTTMFLKGCPLNCKWCHNPESISQRSALAFYESSCKNCGRCISVCTTGAHSVDPDGKHTVDRDKCIRCGKCEEVCPASALFLYGKSISVDEAFEKLMQDKLFYDKSGGGVTLSGGEPLMQPEFCRELLMRLKANGVNTAIDTCGFASRKAIDAVIEFTDTFLFDVKAFYESTHLRATGQSNKIILENLKYIDSMEKSIEVRIPFVPGFNDGEIEEIAELLTTLKSLKGVKLLPYHDYAEDKYTALGMKDTFCAIEKPTSESANAARELLRSKLPNILIE
jgi:pyruvate formate lyase activating enzyme